MEYTRSTSRERKMREQMEPKILVGFGKYDLTHLLELVNSEDPPRLNILEMPPRWRRISTCTPEEIEAYETYNQWAQDNLNQGV